jgi:signal transduction histidine kinase
VQLHDGGHGGGQGLGLPIVRRAVDLLGHRLTLRSVPGRGSRFSLDLPRQDGPPAIDAGG